MTCCSPTPTKRRWRRRSRCAGVIYDGVGHLPAIEAPERVAADLTHSATRQLAREQCLHDGLVFQRIGKVLFGQRASKHTSACESS